MNEKYGYPADGLNKLQLKHEKIKSFLENNSRFSITADQYNKAKLESSPVLQPSPTKENNQLADRTLSSFLRYDNAENQNVKPDSENNSRFSITPEQDTEYLDAVKRGDMETAREMVRNAAAKTMPDTRVADADGMPLEVYHGTELYSGKERGRKKLVPAIGVEPTRP